MLYVSPLKALAYDVERNLRGPLAGLESTLAGCGAAPATRREGAARARQGAARHPDHDARVALPDADVAGARDAALGRDADRRRDPRGRGHQARRAPRAVARAAASGCVDSRRSASACRRPSGRSRRSARFVGGGRADHDSSTPARASRSTSRSSSRSRTWRARHDDVATRTRSTADGSALVTSTEGGTNSIWPSIHPRSCGSSAEHRSTLIFVNSRRLAERLALRLNELGGATRSRARTTARSRASSACSIEEDLKAGRLPASSPPRALELGIDMGAVDLVIQVESPKSVARGLQRIGRAGHEVGASRRGASSRSSAATCSSRAVVARAMRDGRDRGDADPAQPARRARAADRRDVGRRRRSPSTICTRSSAARYPFADLSRAQLEGVLDMLAGRYPSDEFAELRPAHHLGPHRGA